MRKKSTEHELQSALILWRDRMVKRVPELSMLFAIPNGGARHIATARRMKKEGATSGVPDLFLAVARGGFHGLFIEMKTEKGRMSENQKRWKTNLEREGYAVVVSRSLEESVACITSYLNGSITPVLTGRNNDEG